MCTLLCCCSTTDMLFVIYPANALLMHEAVASDSCCARFHSLCFCPSLINCTLGKITAQMQMKWQNVPSNVTTNYSASITSSGGESACLCSVEAKQQSHLCFSIFPLNLIEWSRNGIIARALSTRLSFCIWRTQFKNMPVQKWWVQSKCGF